MVIYCFAKMLEKTFESGRKCW